MESLGEAYFWIAVALAFGFTIAVATIVGFGVWVIRRGKKEEDA